MQYKWMKNVQLQVLKQIFSIFCFQVPEDEVTEISEATDATDISEASDQDNNKKVQ